MNNQPQITIVVPKMDPNHYQYAVLESFLKLYGVKSKTVLERELKGSNYNLTIYLGNGKLFTTQEDKYHGYGIHIGYFASKAWIYCDSLFLKHESSCVLTKRNIFLDDYQKMCAQLKEKVITSSVGEDDISTLKKWTTRAMFLFSAVLSVPILYDKHKSFRENYKDIKDVYWDNDFVPVQYHYVFGQMWFILNCLEEFLEQNGYEKIAGTKDIKADTKETKSENVN
ncbi:MAG: hypothetical protein MJZ20_12390 [Bacteroidaceae bacterium]|nr:hypothetical protein [Bacteroidaceae bacterium]